MTLFLGTYTGFLFEANLQVGISKKWTLQAEISHQKCTDSDEYIDYQNPEFNFKEEIDFSYVNLYLNLLYEIHTFKEEKITLYFISGLGRYQYCPLSSKIGMGVKHCFLSKTYVDSSVSFNSSILMYGPDGIHFLPLAMKDISLKLGLEY